MRRSPLLFTAAAAVAYLPGAFAHPARLDARAVSQELFDNLNLFEQFAAAAYDPINNNSTGDKLTCSAGNCPLVEAADTLTIHEFEDSLKTDVTGYVATDATNKLIVVAFRGSESIRNFITDINFLRKDTDICEDCSATRGFWSSWKEAREDVIAAVEDASRANPTFSVVATGHSLGGAIASFAAAQLRNDNFTVALYTYGAPRLGNEALSDFITNQPGGNFRVTHKGDPVPRLPPSSLGYKHISPEYYISSGNSIPVTVNDINTFVGNDNSSGNAADSGFDFAAHKWYFNNLTDSHPDDLTEFKRV